MPEWKPEILRRLAPLKLPATREAEIVDEIAQHLEDRYQELLASGQNEDAAYHTSLDELEDEDFFARNLRRVETEFHCEPIAPGKASKKFFEGTLQDVRYAVRMLRKSPGFTAVAVLTLALGIGANTALFSVINAVLFRPLPVAAPHELIDVYNSSPDEMLSHLPLAYPDYADFRDNSKTLSGLLGFAPNALALDPNGESEMVTAEGVTSNYFDVLGVQPVLGRSFEARQDVVSGTYPVVVLSYNSWRRKFNADPAIIGSTIRLNGNILTVIGVAPPNFSGLIRGLDPEMWIPLSMESILHLGDPLADRGSQWLFVTGRLRPGVSASQAQAELESIADGLALQYPKSNKDRTVVILPASQVKIIPEVDGAMYATSFVLLGFVGLILLIACANLAGMLLARASARRREIAVRLAMGASRTRLIRQLLTESLLLSLLGGSLGLMLTIAFDRLVSQALQGLRLVIPVQVGLGLTLDYRVFVFTLIAVSGATLLFGLVPAFKASGLTLSSTLKEEAASAGGSRSKHGTLKVLVVGQVAVSLLLLICAGLSIRSMRNAFRVDPGFNPNDVATASFYPSYIGMNAAQSVAFYKSLSDRAQVLPGVRSVALAERLPLTFVIQVTSCAPQGKDADEAKSWQDVDRSNVGPEYSQTMQIPVLRGREFDERDTASSTAVVIVNEALASLFWPGQDPIGRRIRFRQDKDYSEVVGVVRNGKYRTLGEQPRPFVYRAAVQHGSPDLTMLIRFTGDSRPVFSAVREDARQLDSRIPVMQLQSLEDKISVSLLLPQIGATFFGLLGMLGLVLASVGLYGVIAYTASQRTHEIGIRMALGAKPLEILRLVLRQGLVLALVGVAVGLATALAVTRVLSTMLYGISATDAVTFVGISLFLLVVTMMASYIPARRAMRVDPMVALRYE